MISITQALASSSRASLTRAIGDVGPRIIELTVPDSSVAIATSPRETVSVADGWHSRLAAWRWSLREPDRPRARRAAAKPSSARRSTACAGRPPRWSRWQVRPRRSARAPAARAPGIAGLTISGSYLSAGEEAQVGGDWYDLIALRDGRAGIAIGDVVGHGVEAAAQMAHLQSATRAFALEGMRPGAGSGAGQRLRLRRAPVPRWPRCCTASSTPTPGP